ncbi:hypothetical protein [Pseudomonas aeruginosa]|uniref:hypothetical protein n=1 Tax=Pseudomonas aeruginosa TaxID=287 RepID=UPI002255BD8E|nr:hypothetical protein [Pseudomonas aeruginosa]MCX4212098.1 hypothetical protein [Pseudomonas aeruginosa]MCX4230979.1 hypothetical protein [Pseudomonas aeruginosa]
MGMVVREKIEGMQLEFVEGSIDHIEDGAGIEYKVKFKLKLDFTSFREAANRHIPNYLDRETNAIRPELGGLAYHYSYNYLVTAGEIDSAVKVFDLFRNPDNYADNWWISPNKMMSRMTKPKFYKEGDDFVIEAAQAFKWFGKKMPFVVGDLRVNAFDWGLTIMRRLEEEPEKYYSTRQPGKIATLSYFNEDEWVEVGGVLYPKGMKYMWGKELRIGEIYPEQVKTIGE